MTNVKPATDEQVADILGDLHQYHDYKMAECPFCAPIRARIDADREENAGLKAYIASYKDGMKALRATDAAEIAALKAEVERLTPAFLPCHVCGGKGISDIIHGAVVRCENCDGTGRAR